MKKARALRICFSSLLVIGLLLLVGCAKNYTAKFESNGGSTVSSVKFKEGETLTKPADPTKTGVEFAGWYSDIDLLEEFDFTNKLEAKNITLYAKWMTRVTFESNGGSAVESLLKSQGDVVQLPSNVTNGDLVFVGWFTDEALQNQVNQLYIVPAQNATLYAKWSGVEQGTAINLLGNFKNLDDGAYEIENTTESMKITATAAKGEWSLIKSPINTSLDGYTIVYLEFVGTKDVNFVIKLEGGGVNSYETTITMTGERQIVRWAVPQENISLTGGQSLLVFLNGGTVGSPNNEYVEFFKLQFCKMIDANETGEQAIFFDTLGGSTVNAIYGATGVAVEAPLEIPTLSGYTFGGWYTTLDCETLFEFTTMPEGPTTVYAKWIKNPDIKLDFDNPVNIMDDFVSNDEGNYEFRFDEGKLIITATTLKGEWSFFKRAIEAAEANGAVAIRLVFMGKANDKFMIKINNVDEYTVEITGGMQEVLIELKNPINASLANSFIIFYNGGGTVSEDTELIFSNFELLCEVPEIDYENPISIMNEFESNDEGHYTFSIVDGKYVITATTLKSEWSFFKRVITKEEATGAVAIRLVLMGKANDKFMIKINNADEYEVVFTGEKQEVLIELKNPINYGVDNSFIIFYNGGSLITENTDLTFETLELLKLKGTTPEEEKEYDFENTINVMNNWISNDEGHYTFSIVDGKYVMTATTLKSEWSFARRPITEEEATGVVAIKLVFTGVAAEKILIKVNNSFEKWVDITGERQEVLIELPMDINYSQADAFIIFYNGGSTITENKDITFESIEFIKYKN